MITTLGLLGITVYLACYVRARYRGIRFSNAAVGAHIAGTISAWACVSNPLDSLADAALSWHMVQHFILMGISAPLFVLGAPLRLLLTVLPPDPARKATRFFRSERLHVFADPVMMWLQLQFVLYAAHFSPLYEAALENDTIHACEHLLFIVSAALFWQSIFAVAPAPSASPYHVRVLLLVFAIPMGALLGFIFYIARTPWYSHYAHVPGALHDQQFAGALMWGLGSMPMFVVLLTCVAAWAKHDRRITLARES